MVDRFAAWGLQPAGEDGWFQYFKVQPRAAMGEDNVCLVGDRTLTPGVDFRPASSAPKARATGRLVFAGYGISDAVYDDYRGLECAGAIVVAFLCDGDTRPPGVEIAGHPMMLPMLLVQRQVQSARNAGAAGLLLVPPPGGADSIGVLSGGGQLQRMFGRTPPTIPLAIATRAAIEPALGVDLAAWVRTTRETRTSAGGRATDVICTLATEVAEREVQGRNVIGLLPGVDPVLREQFVVIGAHADHVGRGEAGGSRDGSGEIHNGADDNASGTAGLLELAQAFATCPVKPRRSMLFMAFTGEELGLLGSRHWVKNPTRPLGQVAAMVNLDMIGRSVNDRVTAEAVESSAGFQALCEKHNAAIGCDLKFTKGVRGDSDHYSFYAGGVPVIFFFTGLHADYHKSTDDWDKINGAGAEKALRLTYLVAAELTAADERPGYNAIQRALGADRPARGGGGNRVRLGIMPAYDADVQGVKIEQVLPGTPAAQAGLAAGDVIVRLGERDIASMQDLSEVLAAHKPGDAVEAVITRGGERKTLKVTFAARQE